jgi:hypothetical protein
MSACRARLRRSRIEQALLEVGASLLGQSLIRHS